GPVDAAGPAELRGHCRRERAGIPLHHEVELLERPAEEQVPHGPADERDPPSAFIGEPPRELERLELVGIQRPEELLGSSGDEAHYSARGWWRRYSFWSLSCCTWV